MNRSVRLLLVASVIAILGAGLVIAFFILKSDGRLPDGIYNDFVIECIDTEEEVVIEQRKTEYTAMTSTRRVYACTATSLDGSQSFELNLELDQALNAMTLFLHCDRLGLKMISDVELDESDFDVLLDVSWNEVFHCSDEITLE